MKTASGKDIKLMVEFCECVLDLVDDEADRSDVFTMEDVANYVLLRDAVARVRDAAEFAIEEGEEE